VNQRTLYRQRLVSTLSTIVKVSPVKIACRWILTCGVGNCIATWNSTIMLIVNSILNEGLNSRAGKEGYSCEWNVTACNNTSINSYDDKKKDYGNQVKDLRKMWIDERNYSERSFCSLRKKFLEIKSHNLQSEGISKVYSRLQF
jgi:hypothetical protein